MVRAAKDRELDVRVRGRDVVGLEKARRVRRKLLMVIALSPFARTRTRWDKAPRLRDRDFGIGGGFGLERVWRPVRGCVLDWCIS